MRFIVVFSIFILLGISVRCEENPIKVSLIYDNLEKRIDLKYTNVSDSTIILFIKVDPTSFRSSEMGITFYDKNNDRMTFKDFLAAKPDTIAGCLFGTLHLEPHIVYSHGVSLKNIYQLDYERVNKIRVRVDVVYKVGRESLDSFKIEQEFDY